MNDSERIIELEKRAEKAERQRDVLISVFPAVLILEGLVFRWIRRDWIGGRAHFTYITSPNGSDGILVSLVSYGLLFVLDYLQLTGVFCLLTLVVSSSIEKKPGIKRRDITSPSAYIIMALVGIIVILHTILCAMGLMENRLLFIVY